MLNTPLVNHFSALLCLCKCRWLLVFASKRNITEVITIQQLCFPWLLLVFQGRSVGISHFSFVVHNRRHRLLLRLRPSHRPQGLNYGYFRQMYTGRASFGSTVHKRRDHRADLYVGNILRTCQHKCHEKCALIPKRQRQHAQQTN